MNKFLLTVFAAVLFFAAFVQAQQPPRGVAVRPANAPERGIALVIGNATYADAPLKNPVNDATDMAATLKTLGFRVSLHTNLDQNQMKRQIRSFGEQLTQSGAVGLFYYAGHGVQVKGVNYLIPVGAKANSEQEIEYEAVEAGFVFAQMEAANNSANIVILDACRNNPFARSYRSADKGLAPINAPSGTLIAYATAPGSVASDGTGRNGLYTQELLKQIKTDNLSIEEAFKRVRVAVRSLTANKQTPWESSSLVGNFYFSGTANGVAAPLAPADTAAAEAAIWDAIKDSREPNNFLEFIKSFPRSKHLAEAKLRLKQLQSQPANQTASQNPFGTAPAGKKPPTGKNAVSIFNVSANSYGGEEINMAVGVKGLDPAAEVRVFVNDSDVSQQINDQNASLTNEGYFGSLILAGSAEQLNLKVGLNEVYVTINKIKAAPFAFRQLANQMPKPRAAELSKPLKFLQAIASTAVSPAFVHLNFNRGISAEADLQVFLNDEEISSLLRDDNGKLFGSMRFEGEPQQFKFLPDGNKVYVVVDGVKSESYSFKYYDESAAAPKISNVALWASDTGASFVIFVSGADSSAEVQVFLNNADISSLTTEQKDEGSTSISVRKTGKRRDVNLRNGRNEVRATVNGVELERFSFEARCGVDSCQLIR